MLEVEAARALILQGLQRNPAESVAVDVASDQVLAADVICAEDLPPFDNTAMDGYALPLGPRTAQAGEVFEVRGEQAAGDAARASDAACEIMTGARIPDGLDAVVPVEQIRVLEQDAAGRALRIEITAEVPLGQHIRRVGEDIRCGERALPAGTRIGPQQFLLLAGIGCARVDIVRRPRLALFCTGRELVEAGAPLGSGEIRNSNGPYLSAAIAAAGAELMRYAVLPDEPAPLRHSIGEAVDAGAQVILSTGAVSMGRYDFVPEVLRELGAELVFHKLRMRPGKPLLFARLPGGQLYFGLPGNPASSAVGFRFLVCAALRALLGLKPERPWRLPLLADASKKSGFTQYQKACVRIAEDGRIGVELLRGQESFKVRPLAEANAWAALPAEAEVLPAGTHIDVHGLEHWGLQLSMETIA
ncbi:MAG: molybdopterin molybdotransferase MoeA [Xanthomonadales bacterium]|nr:molybdopterin molybdotransferase MoeA [Xanthomonadales bacterium]